MSALHALLRRRHFLASTLAGTIGAFLPMTVARAQTTSPSPAASGPDATMAGASAIAAAPAAIATEAAGDTSIRPFQFHASDGALADLPRRIAATKWPEQETVSDASQGVQLKTMRALARYWETDYDWRKAEARLNSYPQFMTEIDGLDIHFIHVRSKNPNALPVIITHGWPGSIIE